MIPRWGLVATVKAPLADTLHFAAWHIEAGAHRLHLYLDDPQDPAFDILKSHPKLRPLRCDDAHWQGRRPKKHQVRQGQNATHAYRNASDVDWLIHMDVDEFLVSEDVASVLSDLPDAQRTARIRPMEQLAGDGTHFKAFIPPGPDRARRVERLYPTYGRYLKGGFLSHLAGKVFVRTGLPDLRFQIHNAFANGDKIEGPEDTPGIDLAHCHARSWEDWRAAYGFRLQQGSYRAELAPNRPVAQGGMALHDLFRTLEAEGGDAALRDFFDEVCADGTDLRARLDREGLLRRANLRLKQPIVAHFPTYAP